MDRERPSWENDIDLSTLSLGSPEQCILGQHYGTYDMGTMALGLSMRQQYRYGFMTTKEGGCAEYPDLTEAWVNEVIVRFHKAMPAKKIMKPKQSAARQTQASLS
ncbi:MAG: hypothetical protein Q7R63_02185 [bacterium]|nr:hypothetical protein [bacterium]